MDQVQKIVTCGHSYGLVCKFCFNCNLRVENHQKRHILLKECANDECFERIGEERAKQGWLICKRCEVKLKVKSRTPEQILAALYRSAT